MFGASKPACQFIVVERSNQADFTGGPAPWPCFHRDAARFAHGDDFLDGAPIAAGENGVGHFAEQPKFTRPPGCAPAASDFGFSGGRHDFRKQSIHRAEFRELAQAAKLLRSVVHRALVVAENGVIANAKLPRGSFLGSGDFSDGGCIKRCAQLLRNWGMPCQNSLRGLRRGPCHSHW